MDIKINKLRSIINKFPKVRILIIGDLILDEYVWGTVERISPESPVPIVWANKNNFLPGGAANVASNIRSLGAGVNIVGVVGKDERASILLTELKKRQINTDGVFESYNRYTSIKTRIIAGHQQVVRIDWENTDPIAPSLELRIEEYIKKNISKYDAIIIEDYGKGLITPSLVRCANSAAKMHRKIINVDPKENHFQDYTGVTAITPNKKEAENAIRYIKLRLNSSLKIATDKLESDKNIDLAGRELQEFLKIEALLVTLGDKGMRLFQQNKPPYHINTVAQEVFDVSGAGDTVIAVFTLALASGANMQEAAHLANFAAGIVVGKIGVAAPQPKELIEKIKTIDKKKRSRV